MCLGRPLRGRAQRATMCFMAEAPDLDRVLTAAQTAAAHDFIMRLPMGYETKIGESGLSLSGGQKQRTAIARAIIRNPRILVLDDALSSVDTQTEDKS